MVMISLHRGDYRKVRPTALTLAEHWQSDPKSKMDLTLEGLFAEYAVIKYFNQNLGAVPTINFNTQYSNGGDGGFDFKFPEDLSWDVKSTTKDFFLIEHLSKTKANCVIGVRRMTHSSYDIWGFIPTSRFDGRKKFSRNDFRDLAFLKRAFPDKFVERGNVIERYSEFDQVGSIVGDIFRMINLRSAEFERNAKRESK